MSRFLVALGLLVAACGPGQTSLTGSSTESSETESSETGVETGDPTESSGDGDPTESESSTETGQEPECGDGQVNGDEQCDDGPANAWEQAACQPDCTFNECGDGFIGLDESCDPGTGEPDSCGLGCGFWLCGNVIYQCGDIIDNDEDGLVDLLDPDCLSPCDDDEYQFATNLPFNGDCKFDCAFDANTGAGDDHCEWNIQCDPLDPGATIGCNYDPNFGQCELEQLPECLDFCLPLVPNGCDCFGCCEIDGVFRFVDHVQCGSDDPSACPACTPSPSCINSCEADACELCFLQTLEELAPGCTEPSCPAQAQHCTDPHDCPPGEFCQLGCCREIQP
jgi:hypothetical protein